MISKVNLADKFSRFSELWSPKVVGELNGQHVKLVRFQGEYVWHSHENEDELFLVIEGEMDLELCDGVVRVVPGEFIIVPRGVEHRPVAKEECKALLFEPATTRNTGNVDHEYTIEANDLDRI
jgi:mannose-6-phosphate isomerase-like protein (cupin superfamily)